MELLITKADFATHNRDISQTNQNDDVINQFIQDAQIADVKELLGADFFDDLVVNRADAVYTSLLDGGTYTYQGKTYMNYGLKSVLVHFAYARYVLQGSYKDTPFGFVQKESGDSTNVSYTEKKAIYKLNQQTANSYWANVERFILRNKTDYPLYCQGRVRNYKISVIKGDRI